MHTAKLIVAGVGLTALLSATAHAQAGDAGPSPLASLVPQIRALVGGAQPRAEFAAGKDVLVGEYRTHNFTVRLRDADGRRLPPFEQLGPRPGGFYLQLAVAPLPADIKTHVTPPLATRPWTTVISVYPLADGQKAIFMTWEAGHGAPPALAAKVSLTVSHYVAAH